EMGSSQSTCPNHGGQRFNDDVRANRSSFESGGDVLAPPLQPDLAKHRLADGFADSGDLIIERVEREQRFAATGRREQRGLVAVAVVTVHQRSNRRKATEPGGTAFPSRRFP